MRNRASLIGFSFLISSCLFDSPNEPATIDDQIPYAQALLDANGLANLDAGNLSKVYNPGDPHGQQWYLDLENQMLTSFDFTSHVEKLSLYDAIDLSNNGIATVPKNMHMKAWKQILLDSNKLCSLTAADVSSLEKAKASWRGQKCSE